MGLIPAPERRTGRNGPVCQHLTAIALAAMAAVSSMSLIAPAARPRNGIETFRLIIIGIGIRAMLSPLIPGFVAGVAGNGALTAGLAGTPGRSTV